MEASDILQKILELEPDFDLKKYLQKHLNQLLHKQELNAYCDWIIENMVS